MADSWPFKFASGGACTYAEPLKHARRLQLHGRLVCGLVGIQFGWECSPTTFGSVTTLFLVQGKKGHSLSVYPTVEAGGLHGD
jgi:hypothetical protein